MNVLLLSMPDSFEHMPTIAVRMPNGALSSLAGNVDPHHDVSIADLVLVQDRVRDTVTRLVSDLKPDVVGLSVMTFQRKTALKIIDLVRTLYSDIKIVVGGYDPSLAPEAYYGAADFIVRGEGELTFRELLRAIESGSGYEQIEGLTWRQSEALSASAIAASNTVASRRSTPWLRVLTNAAGANPKTSVDSRWVTNPSRSVNRLGSSEIAPPNRDARVLNGYAFLGEPVDVIETSRGCTFDCGFCSIIAMRGRNFYTYSIDRVIEDIADAKAHGARTLFIVDDNIVLNVHRFEELCQAIIDAGHNDVEYLVQAMTSAIAQHGETLGPLMRRAGFRYVFLGIENILDQDLDFLNAKAKNKLRCKDGRSAPADSNNATMQAIDCIHRNDMYVVGGLIVGNPADTAESIDANLRFAERFVDWPYIQHPTPYPGTPMTDDFQRRKLITNKNLNEYDGTTAVVKTENLSPEDIEFLRWRAERWMKVRHIPSVIRRHPLFVMKNWPAMLAHTFRGCSWRTFLGIDDDRAAFARYKTLREQERHYL